MITFEEFQELDLRVGQIESVREHPNADKLYLVDVNTGEDELRQSVAGIKGYYSPEELEGENVVVLNNLEEATIRGEVSEAMLLAVNTDENVVIIQPDEDRSVDPGDPVQ